jgi:glutamine amidotransferase
MSERVALVDYGAGNLRSVHNALLAAGATGVIVTDDPAEIRAADRIVLPGMIDALEEAVITDARPFLGICVGMQLMADAGEEHGRHAGLGWIGGTVRMLEPADPALKVPHMGWNDVFPGDAHPLVVPGEAYFLHSYAFDVADPAHRIAATDHGGAVTAAIGRDNLIGVQFHPEKSQAFGLAFLERFLEWRP